MVEMVTLPRFRGYIKRFHHTDLQTAILPNVTVVLPKVVPGPMYVSP